MQALQILISTETGDVRMGMCIGLGVVMSIVIVGLYRVLRSDFLIYFGLSILGLYFLNAFNPATGNIDVGPTPLAKWTSFMAIAFLYFWYRVIESIAIEKNMAPQLLAVFRFVAFAYIFSWIGSVLFPDVSTSELNAALGVLFYLLSVTIAVLTPRQSTGERIQNLGIALLSASLMQYSALRLGILDFMDGVETLLPAFIFWSTTVFSLFSLLGIIVRVKDQRVKEEMASMQDTADHYLALRDQMNTPLQTLEFAAELIRVDATSKSDEVFSAIAHALERLRSINHVLLANEARMTPNAHH